MNGVEVADLDGERSAGSNDASMTPGTINVAQTYNDCKCTVRGGSRCTCNATTPREVGSDVRLGSRVFHLCNYDNECL